MKGLLYYMNRTLTSTPTTLPDSGGGIMADQKLYKAGDQFVVPLTFQVLKTMGHEDRVFHLCSPVDDIKRTICLKDPFFLICTETFPADEMPDVPAEIIQRAADFINLGSEDDTEMPEEDTGDETDE